MNCSGTFCATAVAASTVAAIPRLRIFMLVLLPSRSETVYCGSRRRSLVKGRGLLEPGVADKIVLDPQLRAGLLQEYFQFGPGGRSLLLIEFGYRQAVQRALLGVVIEISAQHHRPGLLQLQKQGLVPRGMAGRGENQNGAISKHVVLVFVDKDRFAVLQEIIVGGVGTGN